MLNKSKINGTEKNWFSNPEPWSMLYVNHWSLFSTVCYVVLCYNSSLLYIAYMNWGFWCQKQVSHTGISNCIPQSTVGCNYLSLPEIPASGAKVLNHPWLLADAEIIFEWTAKVTSITTYKSVIKYQEIHNFSNRHINILSYTNSHQANSFLSPLRYPQ